MEYETDQERFWAGTFGDEYSTRNCDQKIVASNTALFSQILVWTPGIDSVIELGANIGLNIRAMTRLLPDAKFTAVEINETAAQVLSSTGCDVILDSMLADKAPSRHDLVLAKGILIHIAPDRLPDAYDRMAEIAQRYVIMAEYYNPSPVEVDYRGHGGKLYKRDFAGEFLDAHREFELVATGFAYHRGLFPQDDLTWFVLRRRDGLATAG